MKLLVGLRGSPLSRAQLEEIQREWPAVEFEPVFVATTGDRDKKTSLRDLGQTDFFTKEIDVMLLKGEVDIGLHAAKDLPDPMPEGLSVVRMTESIDPRDSLVMRDGEKLEDVKRVGTSSRRREEMVREMRGDVMFVDVRGTIEERLGLLERGIVDGVVIAEAAIIRLDLERLNRVYLAGETAKNQGRLAIVCRERDIDELRREFV